ncbi:hypothetical protein ACJMK2_021942 [Sinanodonta woodiana]|uniref:SH3 domain-containing protein n=1 Tax=Sinanodonta woodiana TaxID=1069815 RepID=A0ABD3TIT2_SINWO
MADSHTSKGGIFSKKLRRTKTKLLQNFGKTQKTKDETIQEYAVRLDRQHDVAVRFQKDLKNFTHCAKNLSVASKSFFATLLETYEHEWTDRSQIQQLLEGWENLWSDYLLKLQDQIQEPLVKYISHVQPIKSRISKRGRKLIDYDNAKHNLEVQNGAKKKDETKIAKAQEELNEAKKIYEEMNNELHIELQEYYNSRVTCYAASLQNLFAAEQIFHSEVAKISEKISDISEKLYQENEQLTYTPKRPLRDTLSHESYDFAVPNGHEHSENSNNGYESQPSQPGSPRDIEVPETSRPAKVNDDSPHGGDSMDGEMEMAEKHVEETEYENAHFDARTSIEVSPSPEKEEETKILKAEHRESLEKETESKDDYNEEEHIDQEKAIEVKQEMTIEKENGKKEEEVEHEKEKDDEHKNETDDSSWESSSESSSSEELGIAPPVPPSEPPGDLVNAMETAEVAMEESVDTLYEVPMNNKPVAVENLPANYLYSVIATHPYHGEDEDELSFERNDVIYVISYDDPDEQDDGWLMGIKKSDRKRGVFPENFTKKV